MSTKPDDTTPVDLGFLIELHLTTGDTVKGEAGLPRDPTFTAEDLADSLRGILKDTDAAVSFRTSGALGWVIVPSRVVAYARVFDAPKRGS